MQVNGNDVAAQVISSRGGEIDRSGGIDIWLELNGTLGVAGETFAVRINNDFRIGINSLAGFRVAIAKSSGKFCVGMNPFTTLSKIIRFKSFILPNTLIGSAFRNRIFSHRLPTRTYRQCGGQRLSANRAGDDCADQCCFQMVPV